MEIFPLSSGVGLKISILHGFHSSEIEIGMLGAWHGSFNSSKLMIWLLLHRLISCGNASKYRFTWSLFFWSSFSFFCLSPQRSAESCEAPLASEAMVPPQATALVTSFLRFRSHWDSPALNGVPLLWILCFALQGKQRNKHNWISWGKSQLVCKFPVGSWS